MSGSKGWQKYLNLYYWHTNKYRKTMERNKKTRIARLNKNGADGLFLDSDYGDNIEEIDKNFKRLQDNEEREIEDAIKLIKEEKYQKFLKIKRESLKTLLSDNCETFKQDKNRLIKLIEEIKDKKYLKMEKWLIPYDILSQLEGFVSKIKKLADDLKISWHSNISDTLGITDYDISYVLKSCREELEKIHKKHHHKWSGTDPMLDFSANIVHHTEVTS